MQGSKRYEERLTVSLDFPNSSGASETDLIVLVLS